MKAKEIVFIAIVVILIMDTCVADSIKVKDVAYENVIIKESPTRYYVQIPSEGKVVSFNKSDVRPGDISISSDPDLEQKLLAEWNKNSDHTWSYEIAAAKAERPSEPIISSSFPPPPETKMLKITGNSRFTDSDIVPMDAKIVADGQVQYVNLNNVPLRDALRALLRMMNLDYAVENGFIWISAPEIIRAQSFEELETRFYALRSADNTAAKIIVRNAVYGSGAGAAIGPQATGGQFGQGGQTTSNFGAGQPVMGQMYGGGGFTGGGFAGPGFNQPHFSNLVQLFSNIDDRLVGETPAVIGLSIAK